MTPLIIARSAGISPRAQEISSTSLDWDKSRLPTRPILMGSDASIYENIFSVMRAISSAVSDFLFFM